MKHGIGAVAGSALILGFVFIYAPIALLILFSFNDSRLVTVWGGFTTRWYAGLLENEALMGAAWNSLRVGVASATVATVMGTLIALALARFGRFRGRGLLAAMAFAPIVMPEVITALSLLLLFVAVDLDRGALTITLAHAAFTTGFAAAIIGARLAGFDRSLEEAAMDLGAPPLLAFAQVTLPLIAPAIAAAWALAFTLSLDDLVIASFTSGPGSTTLPMRIYSQMRLGVSPDINAVGTLIVLVVTAAVLAATVALKHGERAGAG
ncbi:MAG: putrescine ABC transporter permease PotI [Rhizobiales bacterium 65-9]|nr:ABC transporter permease subunit [Hyphomicrobiales bacterium]OJY32473.1 MAG: putrescine ABC transporter permease PotI [Rhizobiales bacterium 65-9]